MGAAEVAGAKAYGIQCYIKHFALNDSEGYRKNALCTWINEPAMRDAAHNILYSLANSNAMDERNFKMPGWVKGVIAADVIIVLLLGLWEVLTIRSYRKKNK